MLTKKVQNALNYYLMLDCKLELTRGIFCSRVKTQLQL